MPFERVITPFSHQNQGNYCLFWTQYDGSGFQIEAFSERNIPLPTSIANSTESRQSEYFHGRDCAIRALSRLNVFENNIPTGVNRKPVWPNNVKGSISHSERHAASLVSTDTELIGVGIDIEKILPPKKAELISSKVISETEMQLILREHKNSCFKINTLITIIFSAKESYFKAAYEEANRYFGFEYLEVENICWISKSIQAKAALDISKNIRKGKEVLFQFNELCDQEILTYCIIK